MCKRPATLEDEEKFNGNSGCLVHVQGGPEKGTWPKCVEVQGMNRDHGKLIPFMTKVSGISLPWSRFMPCTTTHLGQVPFSGTPWTWTRQPLLPPNFSSSSRFAGRLYIQSYFRR